MKNQNCTTTHDEKYVARMSEATCGSLIDQPTRCPRMSLRSFGLLAGQMLQSIPKTGWPPGDGPENYSFPGLPGDKQIEDVGVTFLGKLAAERGLKF